MQESPQLAVHQPDNAKVPLMRSKRALQTGIQHKEGLKHSGTHGNAPGVHRCWKPAEITAFGYKIGLTPGYETERLPDLFSKRDKTPKP